MASKAAQEQEEAAARALTNGLAKRAVRRPSATPIPPDPATEESRDAAAPGARKPVPAGQGRRGHLRKISVEMTPEEHTRLKHWILNAFGSDARATPVIKALLEQAYNDPALTGYVRDALERRD
ncbi:hypothetical protein [Actinocorallia libanotica]|uniref:Uncharacterized protein n=1 Tax=Actinocorallia libanotica TaxID=46162 RepID=A0ABP4CJJ8_9ACTN